MQLDEKYCPEHYVFDIPSIYDQLAAHHYDFQLDPSGNPYSMNPFERTPYHDIHDSFQPGVRVQRTRQLS